MTLLNRDLFGRRVQALAHYRAFSPDYTLSEWWSEAVKRRGRGLWPRSGPWPIFRYWALGPLELRVWTRTAQEEQR
jgi:hypothetical protein